MGFKNSNRLIVSFIFSGLIGVGKFEFVKVLVVYYFGLEEVMIRFDMSEFMERYIVFKFIGFLFGYVGYIEGG